ncbi:hypothetical protein [Pseudoalteromonas distincta]|uniref:hypothetical protein n=1 Tax=Pseudoalteromonas distincta TaxID=77608 RepID=UPI00241E15EF|nr:hypothetical protein [Pseudoalteromonas distincta]
MSKGAYLFLAFFPLISIIPIPPPTYENVQKAKQEQKNAKKTQVIHPMMKTNS